MKVFGTDYDGVMINIEPQKAVAFGLLVARRWNVNAKKAQDFWFHGNVSGRRNIFSGVYMEKYREKLKDEEYKSVESEFSALLRNEFYPSVNLLPGALDLIKFARSNFDRTFISSGVPMDEINYLANLNGVADYFDLILGTNDQFPTKFTHFNEIRMKWSPQKLFFIADGLSDMKIAKENGAIPIGIPTNHSKEELIDAGAAAVCPLSEVVSVMGKFSLH
jgi:phosphoglycolate phosphatase-like HAD superfamily hydrolase